MKAIVLAAGLGTRLRPLTDKKPKALIEVNGTPLLESVLRRLIHFGVSEVIINLHHFPEQIRSFVKAKDNFGIRVEFSHEEVLLDTGGGLKEAAHFFDDGKPFIMHNSDVISNIDLSGMLQQHIEQEAAATLATNQRKTNRYFIFDESDDLCGWKSLAKNEEILVRKPQGPTTDRAFCGIHVISPALLEKLTETGQFSIVESYLRLAGERERIIAFKADEYDYRDFGKLEQIGFRK